MKQYRFLLVVLLCCLFLSVTAQPGGGRNPGGGEPVPISGIEVLIGLGALFGAKKLFEGRKKN